MSNSTHGNRLANQSVFFIFPKKRKHGIFAVYRKSEFLTKEPTLSTTMGKSRVLFLQKSRFFVQ